MPPATNTKTTKTIPPKKISVRVLIILFCALIVIAIFYTALMKKQQAPTGNEGTNTMSDEEKANILWNVHNVDKNNKSLTPAQKEKIVGPLAPTESSDTSSMSPEEKQKLIDVINQK